MRRPAAPLRLLAPVPPGTLIALPLGNPRPAALLRLLAAVALVTLIAVPIVTPRAAAGEPGSGSFLQVSIERVTPDVVSTTSDAVVTVVGTVSNVGDRPVRDVVVRLEHAAA